MLLTPSITERTFPLSLSDVLIGGHRFLYASLKAHHSEEVVESLRPEKQYWAWAQIVADHHAKLAANMHPSLKHDFLASLDLARGRVKPFMKFAAAVLPCLLTPDQTRWRRPVAVRTTKTDTRLDGVARVGVG